MIAGWTFVSLGCIALVLASGAWWLPGEKWRHLEGAGWALIIAGVLIHGGLL